MLRTPRLRPQDFARLPSFAVVTPSWAGDRIAFFWDKTGRFELYTMDLRDRRLEQLTDGEAPRGLRAGFCWTRDDASIIFARDDGGNEQHDLFRLHLATRKITRLTNDPEVQHLPVQVSPDNRYISVNSNREGQLSLYKFDLEEKSWTRLTDFSSPSSGGIWTADGLHLICQANEAEDLLNSDSYQVRADGGGAERIFRVQEGSRDGLVWEHPGGGRFATNSDASGVYRAGIWDSASGELRWFGSGEHDEFAGRFSPEGRWLSVVREVDAAMRPLLYSVEEGLERELRVPQGMAGGTRFVLDGTKLLIHLGRTDRRPSLFLYDLATDEMETLLEGDHGGIDVSTFVAAEHIHYASSDGELVPALLFVPHRNRAEKKMPAMILAHGGPTSHWTQSFHPDTQLMLDRGILVLQPNVRGSTGYGVRWRDCNIKDWGGGDLEDIAAGVEYLRGRGDVDMDRVGITGGSYGGYLSFIAVVKKPDLFKVGIPWVGISDLAALYKENMEHFRYYFRQQMGDPLEDAELWRDRSATTHAERLKAKLLIGHGTNDPRCPISQARLFRDRLLAAGRREGAGPDDDFEYQEFEMGHGPSGDIAGKQHVYKVLLDFLERRL